jgi:hypothetical protein
MVIGLSKIGLISMRNQSRLDTEVSGGEVACKHFEMVLVSW